MTVTTTAPQAGWDPDLAEVVKPPLVEIVDAGETDERIVGHAQLIVAGDVPEPDPDARVRMASMLHAETGWDIFPELATDRDYVSKLWAKDWESPEDAIYDTE